MRLYSEIADDETEEEYLKISNSIKAIRLSKNLTQEQVSLSMGFTTATFYTNAENNKQGKHFNLEHIIKISKILNVDINEFFKGINTTS